MSVKLYDIKVGNVITLRTYNNFSIIICSLTFVYFAVWALKLLTSHDFALWGVKAPTGQTAPQC